MLRTQLRHLAGAFALERSMTSSEAIVETPLNSALSMTRRK